MSNSLPEETAVAGADTFPLQLFAEIVADIRALGFSAQADETPEMLPYLVLSGRSDSRWWFVPAHDRRITESALALIQPTTASTKLLKSAALTAVKVNQAACLTRRRFQIGGKPWFDELFGTGTSYAFFSGTSGPHRKLTTQAIGEDGAIRGFVKSTSSPAVAQQIAHEALMLTVLHGLRLVSGHIPRVLLHETHGLTTLLATDTLKTAQSASTAELTSAHLSFLAELASKTQRFARKDQTSLPNLLRGKLAAFAQRLPQRWEHRLQLALGDLEGGCSKLPVRSLTHGDFTPWNSFLVGPKLYVFDWEYASVTRPTGHDLAHFMLSAPGTRKLSPTLAIAKLLHGLRQHQHLLGGNNPEMVLLAYLCAHTIHYCGRQTDPIDWPDAERYAALLDAWQAQAMTSERIAR